MSDENNFSVNFGRPESCGGMGASKRVRAHYGSQLRSHGLSSRSRLDERREAIGEALDIIAAANHAIPVVIDTCTIIKAGFKLDDRGRIIDWIEDGRLLPVAVPDSVNETLGRLKTNRFSEGVMDEGERKRLIGLIENTTVRIGIENDDLNDAREMLPLRMISDKPDRRWIAAAWRAKHVADTCVVTDDRQHLLPPRIVEVFSNKGIDIVSPQDFLSIAIAGLAGS